MSRKINKEYFRSALFGFEDALVSTTGVVVGISAGTSNVSFVVLAAIVTVMVEAFSMGAGEFLSEKSVQELDRFRSFRKSKPSVGAVLMFFSYFAAGLIPIIPIFLFRYPYSAVVSTLFAFMGLYLLGYVKGKIIGIPAVRSGFGILFVGGIATLAGLIVGLTLKIY